MGSRRPLAHDLKAHTMPSQLLKTLLLPELIKGMTVTWRMFLSPKYTLNYPEEKAPQSPRFRGLHAQPVRWMPSC